MPESLYRPVVYRVGRALDPQPGDHESFSMPDAVAYALTFDARETIAIWRGDEMVALAFDGRIWS